MKDREEYIIQLERKLDEWKSRIDELKSMEQTDTSKDETVKKEKMRLLDSLHDEYGRLKERAKELRAVKDEDWPHQQSETQRNVDGFHRAYDQAMMLWPPD